MFGLTDSTISLVYALNIASVLLCVGYGIAFWNKGGNVIPGEQEEDKKWVKDEIELEKDFE